MHGRNKHTHTLTHCTNNEPNIFEFFCLCFHFHVFYTLHKHACKTTREKKKTPMQLVKVQHIFISMAYFICITPSRNSIFQPIFLVIFVDIIFVNRNWFERLQKNVEKIAKKCSQLK